jgi:hypothetical protein
MRQNLPNFRNIFVLYHATTPEFEKGYDLVHERFPEFDTIIYPQSNFQFDTMDFIKRAGDYVCFFVDDNIIYRKCELDYNLVDSIFEAVPELTCFTLRLGKNVTIQDQYNNVLSNFPENIMIGNFNGTNILLWSWKSITSWGIFNYSFSVDGHIYKTKDLIPLIDYEFDNPNGFEGRFKQYTFPTCAMACFEQSVLVNTPINIVGSSNNNSGWWHGHTLEELNQKYLDNHQISLNSIMERDVFACHQEIEIEFEKGESK